MLSSIRLFYKFNLRYKKAFFFGMFLLILSRILANFVNFFYKYFVDELPNLQLQPLLDLLLALTVFQIIKMIVEVFADVVNDIYFINSAKDVKIEVFSHLHDLDYSFHATKRSGSLISAIKRGDGAFWSFNMEINRNLIRLIVDFIFIVVTFFALDTQLMLVVVGIVAINLASTFFLIKKNITRRETLNEQDDKISAIVVDNMINYETVKYFAKEDREVKRMEDQHKTWKDAVWAYANTFRAIDVVTGSLAIIGTGITVLLALIKAVNSELSLGEFVLVTTFVTSFFPKLEQIVYRFREIAKHQTDLEKYLNILNIGIDIRDPKNPKKPQEVKGDILYKDVSFNYKGRQNIISDLNLHIQPGESIAFVGKSGAGKTTLTKLLMRFYDVDKGSITIDGIDIRDMTKKDLRSMIGIVPQDPILFNDTIAFNIGYAKDDYDLEEIKQAAEIANLSEFIDILPKQYETEVGERGLKLSGGQKQRLSIARMFIEDPPIIIFDEATSQLDSHSEKLIQDSFWKVAKDRTTIIIAHRLSTIQRVDKIVVLEDGRIVETGRHDELIKKENGAYNRLWKLQSGGLLTDQPKLPSNGS